MTADGPLWVLCDVERLVDGRVRVLVRKRGGRLLRVTVAASEATAAKITDLVDQLVPRWPDRPPTLRG